MEIHELSGPWGSLRVAELGACVLSWRPTGRADVLWPARDDDLVEGRMWHGGIPVCAPWFGVGRGAFPVPFAHGLVSRVAWETVSVERSDGGAAVELATSSAAVAHLPGADLYPADLGYRLLVRASARELEVSLTVASPTREVVVDLALHPYLACDAPSARVSGLAGVEFRDFAADATPAVEEGDVAVGRHVDRVYRGAPPLTLVDAVRSLMLRGTGARNTIVWNPGPGGGQIPGDGWRGFACVEFGCVQGDAVTLPAGGSHTLSLSIRA